MSGIAPETVDATPLRTGTRLWFLSGASRECVRAKAESLLAALDEAPPDSPVAESCPPAPAAGTERGTPDDCRQPADDAHRAVVLADTRAQLRTELGGLVAGRCGRSRFCADARPHPRTVFVFPGVGAQWRGMAADLLDDSAVFRRAIGDCADALAPHVDWRLPDVLRCAPGAAAWERVDVIQPALFSVMVGLAQLWRSVGVEPAAVIGHSNGEIPAAVVSGGLSLEDGALLVARWSRLQIPLSGRGAMMLVPRRPEEVVRRLARMEPGLHLAAYNGPRSTALSGRVEVIERAVAIFNAEGVKALRINIDVPAHTRLMDIREELLRELAPLRPRASAVPFYSSLAGGRVDTRELGPEYWYRCMSEPVLFEHAVRALADADAFLELSPHPVLTVPVRQTLEEAGSDALVVGSLRRGEPGARRVLAALAELYVHGVPVRWGSILPTPDISDFGDAGAEFRQFPDSPLVPAAGHSGTRIREATVRIK